MTTDLISREAAIAVMEKKKAEFMSERYAVGQPLSSLAERFAIDCCIEALTNMPIAEIGLPYVKFDDDLLATLRNCKGAVITIQEKP